MGGDLRVGVVGCGARGGLARLAHAPGRGSRVVGVCEPVPRRQDAAREALGRLALLDLPFLFFLDAAQGRASALYRRHDGDYGLITPAG